MWRHYDRLGWQTLMALQLGKQGQDLLGFGLRQLGVVLGPLQQVTQLIVAGQQQVDQMLIEL